MPHFLMVERQEWDAAQEKEVTVTVERALAEVDAARPGGATEVTPAEEEGMGAGKRAESVEAAEEAVMDYTKGSRDIRICRSAPS